MKQFLFDSVAATAKNIIMFNLAVGSVISGLVALTFNGVNAGVDWLAKRLLIAIDRPKFDYFCAIIEQRGELSEFSLMAQAAKIKDDAMTNKVWTSAHTIGINQVAHGLKFGCGWEEKRIHQYLRGVVETIPGMSYTAGDEIT
jgi:hypothetical protein